MRHPSLNITDEQEANLRKLAAYLLTLPADYPDFEMSLFTNDGRGYGRNAAHKAQCGTAACAAGHGPLAGIKPKHQETWINYTARAFAAHETEEFDWCFSANWAEVDNTVHGAVRRIHYMLNHGLPEDACEQRYGDAALSYETTALAAASSEVSA